MQNVAKFRLIAGLYSTSTQYVRIVANMSTFSILAQYVRMSLKEPLCTKLPQMTFLGLLSSKQIFSLQKSTKFLMPPKKVCSGSKIIIFEK